MLIKRPKKYELKENSNKGRKRYRQSQKVHKLADKWVKNQFFGFKYAKLNYVFKFKVYMYCRHMHRHRKI